MTDRTSGEGGDDTTAWARERVAKLPKLPDGTPYSTLDLPRQVFPFTVTAIDEKTNDVLWRTVVEGPGPIRIPGLAPRKVTILIAYADGTWRATSSTGECTEGGG